MRRLRLPWRASDGGGTTSGASSIQAVRSYSLWLRAVGPTEFATGGGSSHCNGLPPRPALPSPFATCLRPPAHGTRSSTAWFLPFPSGLRGKPLLSLETIIELISHTTTEEGLTVTAVKDATIYPTGIKVSDEEMAQINLTRAPFQGEWNQTIRPQ
jgi:hypothetical protein